MTMETGDLILGKARYEDWESMYRNSCLTVPENSCMIIIDFKSIIIQGREQNWQDL